jgi:acyl-CoA hydrolase
MNFGEVPDWYRRFIDPCDILILKTAPMDENGYFNLACPRPIPTPRRSGRAASSSRCRSMPGGVRRAERDPCQPVDYIIDEGSDPLPELKNPPVSDIDRKIAGLIAAEVEDGACLQIGIGGMPNAVCSMLKEAGVKDLGIHTEMLAMGWST